MLEQYMPHDAVLVCRMELCVIGVCFSVALRCVAAECARALVYCWTRQCAELTATLTATSACSTASKSRHVAYFLTVTYTTCLILNYVSPMKWGDILFLAPLSVCPSVRPSVCPSVRPSVCPGIPIGTCWVPKYLTNVHL